MKQSYRPVYLLLIIFTITIGVFTWQVLPDGQQKTASAASYSTLNVVQRENQLPGTTGWKLTHPTPLDTKNYTYDQGIEGYSSVTSAQAGDTIGFAVSTTTSSFNADIYRLGWYQGNGARLVSSMTNLAGKLYPVPSPDPQTG